MEPKFHIKQHRDARSFEFTNETEPCAPVRTELRIIDPESGEYLYEVTGELSDSEIFTEDIVYPHYFFKDGVYKFQLAIFVQPESEEIEYTSEWEFFGFAALTAGEVMANSLAYKPEESKQKKEWIIEQQRLLTNLKYAAETGNIEYYKENLEQLSRIINYNF